MVNSLTTLRIEFPALTGIRAIAAYMIFIHHYPGSTCSAQFWCPIVLEFHSGVSIFLVLSGFLITLRYYESSSLNFSWLKKYFISRFARIYPLYFLLTLITLIITAPKFLDWFLSLTLLKGFFSQYRFIGISQSWTLTVEVLFYFLAPVMFIISKKKGSPILQFILIYILGILISTNGQILNLNDFLSSHIFLFVYTFFGRSFEFFTGIFLALFILKMKVINSPTIKYTYTGFLGVILTLILISTFQSENYRFGIYSPEGLLTYSFILPLFIAILFLGLIAEKTLFSKILSSRIFQLLGKSSYAFYLIHVGIFSEMVTGFFRQNLLIFFISLNFISIVLYYLVERPANLGVKNLAKKINLNKGLPLKLKNLIYRRERFLG